MPESAWNPTEIRPSAGIIPVDCIILSIIHPNLMLRNLLSEIYHQYFLLPALQISKSVIKKVKRNYCWGYVKREDGKTLQ